MNATAEPARRLDPAALEQTVEAMYRDVALAPHGEFHFEMGRGLVFRLGYAPSELDAIPNAALVSFAGVGYYFDLVRLHAGETVVDLGSGSGMDSFIAAGKVGKSCDAVMSNGVINLAPDKGAVFREAARLLRPGGRPASEAPCGSAITPRQLRPRDYV